MTLGVLVVYLLDRHYLPLLNTHLERIALHTATPYTLYAGVRNAAPWLHDRLIQTGRTRMVALPTIALPENKHRQSLEHGHCLDVLAEHAAAGDVTHCVTLHLDSFPIRDGWDLDLVARLDEHHPVVMPSEAHFTSCLLYSQAFYRLCTPRFRLEQEVFGGPDFSEFRARHGMRWNDSGTGFVHAVLAQGLECRYLKPSAPRMFEDFIFHIGGAARFGEVPEAERTSWMAASVDLAKHPEKIPQYVTSHRQRIAAAARREVPG